MKILHFSDLHLQDRLPEGWSWLLDKRLLGTLTQRLRRARTQDLDTLPRLTELAQSFKPDVMVCTGDLTTVALPGEFQRAMTALAPLKHLVAPDCFLYVPGNHDTYIDRPEAVAALRDVTQQLRSPFYEIDFQPFQRKLGDVTFIVLNASQPRPFWNSGGILSSAQIQQLERLLSQPRVPGERRVILCHFPIYDAGGQRLSWRRRMSHDQEVRKLLEQGLSDAYLCGHVHTPFVYQNQHCMQICAGSLTIRHQAALIQLTAQRLEVQLVDVNTLKTQSFQTQ